MLHDIDAIALGAVAGSSLTVRAGGPISDTPGRAIEVAGAADFTAQNGAASFDIALDNLRTHDFSGVVNARGQDVILEDRNAIVLGTVDASSLTVDAVGSITDVPGRAIRVIGVSDFAAQGADVVLDGNGDPLDRPHDFGLVNARGAGLVLHDANAIALGAIDAFALTVSAAGAISDTPGRAITVAGPTDLMATSGPSAFDIALDGNGAVSDRPHDFGGMVSALGDDVVLHDRNGIALGAVDASSLAISAGGSITDTPGEVDQSGGDGRSDCGKRRRALRHRA